MYKREFVFTVVNLVLMSQVCDVNGEHYRIRTGFGYSSYSMKQFNDEIVDEVWNKTPGWGYGFSHFDGGPFFSIQVERSFYKNFAFYFGVGYLKVRRYGEYSTPPGSYGSMDVTARAISIIPRLAYRAQLVKGILFLSPSLGPGYYRGALIMYSRDFKEVGGFTEAKIQVNGSQVGFEEGVGIEWYPSPYVGIYWEYAIRHGIMISLKDDKGKQWLVNGSEVKLDFSGSGWNVGIGIRF